MSDARYYHQTVELNGSMKLLVTGGRGAGAQVLNSTEIFDVVLGQFNLSVYPPTPPPPPAHNQATYQL